MYDGYPEQCIVKKHGGNDRQSSTQEYDRLPKGIESRQYKGYDNKGTMYRATKQIPKQQGTYQSPTHN